MVFTVIGLFTVGILCYLWLRKYYFERNGLKLLPGPIGLPIVGHFPFFGAEPYKTFLKWKQKYGPIISVRFGSSPAVVVTDSKMIKELLNQYATADRPHNEVISEISHGYKGLIFGCAGPAMEQRQFILRNLRDLGVGKNTMEEKIMDEVKIFMMELEHEVESMPPGGMPIRVNSRFKANVVNSFWSIFMSRKFERTDPNFDRLIKAVSGGMDSPGALGEMAMFMPWLAKLIPRFSGLEARIKGFQAVYDFAQKEIDQHDETRIPLNPRDFTDAYLDKVDATTDPNSSFHKSRDYQQYIAGDMFFGSLDTTSTALDWLVNSLVRNPAVQEKIYQEVTRVTSQNSRLPSLSDRTEMPYTEAVIHEVLRFRTVGPLSLLHYAMEDITIQDYIIPKGWIIVSNLYGVSHDPENFENPDEFLPERFLEKENGCQKVKRNVEGNLPFGYGKRACVGKAQAMDTLFLFTASLVQKFIFECWSNEMPSVHINHGIVATPDPFRVKVSIRSN